MGIFRGMLGGRADDLGRSIAITSSLTTTAGFSFESCAGGTLYVPSGSGLTSLTFYVAPSEKFSAGNYMAAYDDSSMSSPAAVVLTVSAGNAYPIPSCLFGCGAILIVGNTAGSLYVTLKG